MGEGWNRIDVPDVVSFHLDTRTGLVHASPAAGVTAEAVHEAYYTAALPLFLQAIGHEALHASAVLTRAGVVSFCAFSGTGKSTTAVALSRRGYPLWSDDVVVFDAEDGCPVVSRPTPFRSRLRLETRAFLDAGDPSKDFAHHAAWDDAVPLAAVFLLDRLLDEPVAPIEVTPLPLQEAFTDLLPHGFRFTLDNMERTRSTMESYLRLAAEVPVFRARFPSNLDTLDRFVDALEDALAGVAEGPL